MEDKTFYKPGFMDLTDYRLEEVEGGLNWDDMVEASEQGTIFSLTSYLENLLDSRPRRWICRKGNESKAGLIIMESDDQIDCVQAFEVIHSGILFASPSENQSNAQSTAEHFRITSYIVSQLVEMYRDISFNTHPSFIDIRPFLWHNYGTQGPKFEVAVRYTSLIDIASLQPGMSLDANPVYLEAGKSRRQEIRYGIKDGIRTCLENDIDTFIQFYELTFLRQNKSVDESNLLRLKGLVKGLMDSGLARMYISNTANGEPGSIAIFGVDSKRAYYLFGANSPSMRNQKTGTMVIWDALSDLAAIGVKEVDLEGVNSPLRGHFKLSFGGSITPYYQLRLNNNSGL